MILIGTNNAWFYTPAEIAMGVNAVVSEVRSSLSTLPVSTLAPLQSLSRLPTTRILLLALFPREMNPHGPLRSTVAQVNDLLSTRYQHTQKNERVVFINIGDAFLGEKLALRADLMPDALHCNEKGYEAWAQAIRSTLDSMMQST
jgi:lysophospholipase L1-like esterase